MEKGKKQSTKTRGRAASGRTAKAASGSRRSADGRSARASAARRSQASAAGRPGQGQGQGQGDDALEVLKRQHREVESLFEEFEKASSEDEAMELAETICEKLTIHATIEEELFYPAARRDDTNDLLLEAAEEHLSAKRLIADIQNLEAHDERLRAKVSVLKEQVLHHVEEEEGELFPKTRKALPKEDRAELGQKLLERATQLEQGEGEGGAGGRGQDHAWPRERAGQGNREEHRSSRSH